MQEKRTYSTERADVRLHLLARDVLLFVLEEDQRVSRAVAIEGRALCRREGHWRDAGGQQFVCAGGQRVTRQ